MKVKKCSLPAFRSQFSDKVSCMNYLADLKWSGVYSCSKCAHTVSKRGSFFYDKRCQSCGYNETPTACTLFHSIKLPLPIAFEMLYRICVSKKGISAMSLAREYSLNYKTAYNFKRKVQHSMTSSLMHPLEGIVHVDEFVYGSLEAGCQGRNRDSKKLKVCVAMELVPGKKKDELLIGRAYALPIEDYSNTELRKIFDEHISKSAKVTTDKWKGYLPIGKDYNLDQKLSNKGKNFPQIHNLIMNLKAWIRGIHHSIGKAKAKHYLDEFFYRFNRRTFMSNMPNFTLKSMIKSKPIPVTLTKSGYYG